MLWVMNDILDAFAHVRTRRMLHDQGADVTRIRQAIDRGTLVRLRSGVYADRPWAEHQEREKYRLLHAVAYHLAADRPPVFVRRTAAVVHGLPLVSDPGRTEIGDPGKSGRRAAGVHVFDLDDAAARDVVVVDGLRATGLVDTMVDLTRYLPILEALPPVEGALNSAAKTAGYVNCPTPLSLEFAARLSALSGRATARARRMLETMSEFSESPGESLARYALLSRGLAAPVQQHWIGDFRVDFAWPRSGLILEFDGLAKYRDPNNPQSFVAEKKREALLVEAGWKVVRTTWGEVVRRPDHLIARLRSAGVPPARST